jgi:hypothetical protein
MRCVYSLKSGFANLGQFSLVIESFPPINMLRIALCYLIPRCYTIIPTIDALHIAGCLNEALKNSCVIICEQRRIANGTSYFDWVEALLSYLQRYAFCASTLTLINYVALPIIYPLQAA